jgi:hypothetical protein
MPTHLPASASTTLPHQDPKFDPAIANVGKGEAKKNVDQFIHQALYPKTNDDDDFSTIADKTIDKMANGFCDTVHQVMPFKKSQAAAVATGAAIGGLIGLIGGPPGVVLGAIIGGWLGGKARSEVHEAIYEGAVRSGLDEHKLNAVVGALVPSTSSEDLKNLKAKYDDAAGKLHLKLMILTEIQTLTGKEVDLSMLGPTPPPQVKASTLTPGHLAGGGPLSLPVPPINPPLFHAWNAAQFALREFENVSSLPLGNLTQSESASRDARYRRAEADLAKKSEALTRANIEAEKTLEIRELEGAWRLEIQILTVLGGKGMAAARKRHEAVRAARKVLSKT